MKKTEFLKRMQRYVANIGISGSSLRNQGTSGVVAAARQFLAEVDLTSLSKLPASEFQVWLDKTTESLLQQLPEKARRWGAARKAINIFTTQAFLNGELNSAFNLSRFGDHMETPLDSVAAKELRKFQGGNRLPSWKSVGGLTEEVSHEYQLFALQIAHSRGIPRACLDMVLWRAIAD